MEQKQQTKYQYLIESIADVAQEARADWRDFPCIIWPFSKNPTGYGQLSIKDRPIQTHIVSYEYAYGERDKVKKCRISHLIR